MERRIYSTMAVLGLVILFIAVPILSINTQIVASDNDTISSFSQLQETIDMLIFISPQYKEDKEIRSSIDEYILAVKEDIDWTTKIVPIDLDENDFKKIDQIIEQHYLQYNIKACIMVGEDIDTALAGDSDYMEKPSIIPWSTIGGETSYEISTQGIVSKPYPADVFISLLYPTHSLEYNDKKSQIINSFNKFSVNRQSYFLKEILAFESGDINKNSKEIYQQLGKYISLIYVENPSNKQLKMSLNKPYSIYLVHGHSNPSGTNVNAHNNLWFSADAVDKINAPFFGADGCYVNGWWSEETDNNNLDLSVESSWYGSKIFTNNYIRIMVLGLLSQNGFSQPVSFIENAMPDIIEGKTIAESVLGNTYSGNTIFIGDPSFHFIV